MFTTHRWIGLLVGFTLTLAGCGPGAGAQDASAAVGPASDADLVYVAIQGEAMVAMVDAGTLEEVGRIDLRDYGFSENAKPHHIAVEPDGSFWYLSLIGENRVLKFDGENRLVDQAEFQVPGMLAVHPGEDLLFVGRSMSAVNPPQRVGALRRSDLDVEEWDVFFPRPHAIAVGADGSRIYSASLAVNQLAAVDVATGAMELANIGGPTHTLVQFAVSPDGKTLVATAQLTGLLLVFDITDPDQPVLTDEIAVGSQPWHPVFGPDGRTVYFGVKMDDAVVAVDVEAGTVKWRTTDPGIHRPHGSALSADGTRLFISSNGPGGMQMGGGDNAAEHDAADHTGMDHGEMDHAGMEHASPAGTDTGTLAVLDTATGDVLRVLEMGSNTTGVGIRAR